MEVYVGGSQVFVFILVCSLQTGQACNIQAVKTYCNNYDKISHTFPIYATVKQLENKCSILQPALECSLDDRYAKGCHPRDTMVFRSQRNVIDALCGRWKQESLEAVSCFKTVRSSIEKCVDTVLKARRDYCKAVESTFTCAVAVAKDAKQCDVTSKWLLERTLLLYLQPVASLAACGWRPLFTFQREVRTTAPPPTTEKSFKDFIPPETTETTAHNRTARTGRLAEKSRTQASTGNRGRSKFVPSSSLVVASLVLSALLWLNV